MERRRMVSIKAADQNAIDSPLMSSMKEKVSNYAWYASILVVYSGIVLEWAFLRGGFIRLRRELEEIKWGVAR